MHPVYDFLANTSDGVFAVDRRQRVVLWNRGATRILGHAPGEALGRPCFGMLCGRDADGCAICRPNCELIRAARRCERVPNADVHAKAKDGQVVWINVSTVVFPGRDHEMSALVHLFHEIRRPHEVEDVVEQLAGSVARLTSALPPAAAAAEPGEWDDEAAALTPREGEVLGLLAEGLSTGEMAAHLCISPRTVRNHVQNLLEKLDVHSRLEAVTIARRHRLI